MKNCRKNQIKAKNPNFDEVFENYYRSEFLLDKAVAGLIRRVFVQIFRRYKTKNYSKLIKAGNLLFFSINAGSCVIFSHFVWFSQNVCHILARLSFDITSKCTGKAWSSRIHWRVKLAHPTLWSWSNLFWIGRLSLRHDYKIFCRKFQFLGNSVISKWRGQP